jgi:hypothetical protein
MGGGGCRISSSSSRSLHRVCSFYICAALCWVLDSLVACVKRCVGRDGPGYMACGLMTFIVYVRIVLWRCASLNDDPSVVLGDAPALDERPGRAGGSRFLLGSFVFLFYFWFWFPDPHQPARSLSPLESQCLYRLHSTAIALVLIRSALREIGLALCVLVVRLCALHTQKTTSRAEWMCLAAKYKEKRRKE